MKRWLWVFVMVGIYSCKVPIDHSISKAEMLEIVKVSENVFRYGIQQGDSATIVNNYTDNAQFIQPNNPILKGKKEIGKAWGLFLRSEIKPIDLFIETLDVRGTRDMIYETGHACTLMADSSKYYFNYVNVWRLQDDGSYKSDIDTYIPTNK